jgi:hypothetical protein
MTNGDKPVYITRREFYGALGIVWFYIMLVLGDLFRLESRWTTGILWLASFVLAMTYVAQASLGARGSGSGRRAALSERVKEIASDPSRKLEAIQAYREETGASLADAKEAVEAFIDSK